jgi:hypothetical protein
LQQVFRDLLDPHSDAKAVHWPHGIEGLQNQEIESSLEDFGFGRRHDAPLDGQQEERRA